MIGKVQIFVLLSIVGGANLWAQTAPDYAELKSWLAHPAILDASDISALENEEDNFDVDIFYLHPTTYYLGIRKNGSTTKQNIRRKGQITLANQASTFHGLGRIYAPSYRQAKLSTLLRKNDKKKSAALEFAYQDIRRSFLYYLENWNRGRPIIIAGHSQGSIHGQRLLHEFFDSANHNQLIVAYLPGYDVPINLFSTTYTNIAMCRDSFQTGCMVSWKTYGKHANFKKTRELLNWLDTGYVNNKGLPMKGVSPLNWTPSSEYFTLDKSVTCLRPTRNLNGPLRTVQYSLSAEVIDGNLVLSGHNKFLFNGAGDNLHIYDFNLFYGLIHNNAQLRIEEYYNKGGGE